MPARPRGVDFTNPLDLPVVVVAFRCEMFPHKEIGGAVIDGGAKGGEGLEGEDGEGGRGG